ncbi:MAG: glycosyltransferase, partial [Acetobacterium sp.]|nr:glycosyltransferase [Acetobacterium sp.]
MEKLRVMTMREALISVIMPVYNAEKRLEMSINSVLNQTYQQLELILIDDGSTDSSAMICDQYARADKRVMVVHQENARVSAARNRGIQLATGEYLSFIDADDTIDPETYAVVMKQFTDRSIDMVIYGMQFDYYKNQKLQKRHIKRIEKNYCFNVKNINAHFSYLSDQNYFLSSCNKVIKSTIINDNQIVFEKEMSIL